MKKTINLNAFTSILKKGEAKNVELSIDGQKTSEGYEVKLKSISVTKEMFRDLGFDETQIIKGGVTMKQPTLKEIVLNGFKQVNQQFEQVNNRLDNIENRLVAIENTPTMKKELDKTKSKIR